MIKILVYPTLISVLLFSLQGCATRGNAISQDGKTMAEVYEEAMEESKGNTLDQLRHRVPLPNMEDEQHESTEYTSSTINEINNLFPLLPNPQLVMYVYPHLVGDEQIPVPGYATAFPLYNKHYYAKLGEIS